MNLDDWGKKFEVFDFGHAQTDAGSSSSTDKKLNDVDLKAILICMDAKNNTKSLKLMGCVNINGSGLEPLLGSSVLERIDLSLVFKALNTKDIRLSEEITLPILRSFLGEQSSLRHIQLPSQWREKKCPDLTAFLEYYNDFLEDLGLTCQHKKRGGGCDNEAEMGMHLSGERYGTQTATCHDCLKHFCTEEECMWSGYPTSFDFCPACQKYYCGVCSHVQKCTKCQKSSCMGCFDVHLCHKCFESYCMSCNVVNYCSKCYKASCMQCEMPSFCSECFTIECNDCSEMMFCMECFTSFCGDCGAGKVRYCEIRSEVLCNECYRK